jgi:beta-xylosidase
MKPSIITPAFWRQVALCLTTSGLGAMGCHVLLRAGNLRAAEAAAPPAWGQWQAWGDQGDGTYRNPILPSDYSDLDCIRVGTDYYAISSTFQFSPGVIVLHSRDLVNWRIVGHVVPDLRELGPEFNWDRMDRYGRGIWAGALRFHAGKFWVYFGTPDEGFFMSTAENPAGPWEPLHSVLRAPGWDDGCPFWDDDGQGYFVCTQFAADSANGKKYNIHLFRLTADGRDLDRRSDVIIHQSPGSEANKLYKINGFYYHLYSEVRPGEGRVVMMGRGRSLYGPYETRQLSRGQRDAHEPNQGGIVDTPAGSWYFLTHHGTGSWEGRAASLLPVTWREGWPILGRPDATGIGTMVWSARKPTDGGPPTLPQTSDDFAAGTLAPEWEWNYQPRPDKWSLTERSGFLRLRAFRGLDGDNLLQVGNLVTQRVLRASNAVVIVRLEFAGLANGQHAGLSHFTALGRRDRPAASSASIGVGQVGTERAVEFSRDGRFTRGPVLTGETVWLKSTWGLEGESRFAFSTDGRTFTPFGPPYPFTWGSYRGDRIALFTFNNRADNGFVDFGDFRYSVAGPSPPGEK